MSACLPADVPVVLREEGGAADAAREGASPRSGGRLMGAVKNVLNKPKEAMQVRDCCKKCCMSEMIRQTSYTRSID